MVTHLVRGDVLLGQRAVGTTQLTELLEEGHVEVGSGVARAVERSCVCRGVAATGAHIAAEERDACRLVFEVGLARQDLGPDLVDGARHGFGAAVVVLVGGTWSVTVAQVVIALALCVRLRSRAAEKTIESAIEEEDERK